MSSCCPPKRSDAFDLAIIGAGSAGFSAAITAAEGGKSVALIGHGTIGGTCVNVGCVPSKTMIRAAEAIHGAGSARRFPGISGEARIDDWAAIIAGKDALVEGLRRKKYADLLPAYPSISYIDEGPATLARGGVRVGARAIEAPKIIIASGARPSLPPIPGIESVPVLNSTSLLNLDVQPKSLIVLGGGYIGAELAQMMARMGVEVTVLCRSRLLPRAEIEASAALAEAFRDEGVRLRCGVAYEFCRKNAVGVAVGVKDADGRIEMTAERLLVATGRTPNTVGLGLEEMGVETDRRGAVIVGDDMRTTTPGIYAAGDVTDREQFVYMAAYGAKIAATNAVLGGAARYDNTVTPWVVFTDPQVAGVGMTEEDARKAGIDVKTSILPLSNVPRALAARDTRGVIKLVADARRDILLGGVIVAPEGADSIQTLALAIKNGMTAKALGETVFPYLTMVEGLKLAAQTFDKDVAKLSCCAG